MARPTPPAAKHGPWSSKRQNNSSARSPRRASTEQSSANVDITSDDEVQALRILLALPPTRARFARSQRRFLAHQFSVVSYQLR